VPGESVTWLQMAGSTLGIVSVVVGAGVAYLRLFVRNEINGAVKDLVAGIDDTFARKTELDEIRRRLDRLEDKS
jgi:hypothetical protein